MSQNETKKIDDLAVPEVGAQDVKGGCQNNLTPAGLPTQSYHDSSPIDAIANPGLGTKR